MNRGGLCAVCLEPGACCKKLNLSGGPRSALGEHVGSPMSFERAEHIALKVGIPFRPSEQRADGTWLWTCNQLTDEGLCGIYESRPALCRSFAPGQDPLCVHFVAR